MAKKKKTEEKKPEPEVIEDGSQPFILNPQWELFCQYYTKNTELFGNATHSYAEAYDYKLDELDHDDAIYEETPLPDGSIKYGKIIEPSTYSKAVNVCAVQSNRLLRNSKIQTRITKLLNELMTDEFVDSQLVKVITQDRDLSPKVAAIKQYNELKARIIKKTELTGANGGAIVIDDNSRAKTKSAIGRFLSGNRENS